MYTVPGFWSAAIELAGKVDFGMLGPCGSSGWSRATLAEVVPAQHVNRLMQGRPMPSPDPFVSLASAASVTKKIK